MTIDPSSNSKTKKYLYTEIREKKCKNQILIQILRTFWKKMKPSLQNSVSILNTVFSHFSTPTFGQCG